MKIDEIEENRMQNGKHANLKQRILQSVILIALSLFIVCTLVLIDGGIVTSANNGLTLLQTFENETRELTHISTSDGQTIVATPGHKFYANGAWISAEDLRAGDVLVNVNGQKVIVEAVQHEILENSVKVYNFEVQDNHTYFVGGGNGVAVHNAKCGNTVTYNAPKPGGGVKPVKAVKQPNGYYLAKDTFGHGGSQYKLLKGVKGGHYLELIGDTNAAGELITKHSSKMGVLFEVIKGLAK
jgi:hypothetical protein